MNITRQVVSVGRLPEPQWRVFLRAREAFVAAGGAREALAAAMFDESGNLCEAVFYKDTERQQRLACVRIGADGAPQPVEWL